MSRSNLLYAFLFLLSLVNSQNRYAHYTTSNGLPHDITYGLLQDKQGYIWIGTDNGAVKYDGFNFLNYTIDNGLNNNYVIDIEQDDNGNILLATWGGRLNILNDSFTYQSRQHINKVDKLSHLMKWKSHIVSPSTTSNYFSVFSSEGNEYIQSLYYVGNVNNDLKVSLTNRPESRNINIGISVANDSLFIHNSPLERENKKEIYGVQLFEDDLKVVWPFLKDKIVSHIFSIKENENVAFSGNEMLWFNGKGINKIEKLTFINDLEIVKAIMLEKSKLLLLASDNKGFRTIYKYNLKTNEHTDLKKALNIKAPISDAIKDHEGNIWISTYGEGVFCYYNTSNKFNYIDTTVSGNSNFIDIIEHNGAIFALSRDKLIRIKDYQSTDEITLNGFAKSVETDNSVIYISSLNINKPNIKISKDISEVLGYKLVHDDRLGLIKVLNNELEINDSVYRIEEKVDINDVVYYKNNLLVATNLGLFKYEFPQFRFNTVINKSKGLLSSNIRDLEVQDSLLWVATDKGLNCLRGKEIQTYTEKDGLVDNNISSLCADHKGQLWIGTQKGASLYSHNVFRNLSVDNGLLSSFTNKIFESSDKEIYLVSNKGITIIDNKIPLSISNSPIFNVERRNYTFKVNPISFNRSSSIKAQFSLNNEPWKSLNFKEEVDFSNYKEGKYNIRFRVNKIDSEWKYSNNYNFKITLPWYKKWWIISFSTLLVSIIVVMLIYIQLKRNKLKNQMLRNAIDKQLLLEKRLNNVRQNIAQDFHDELGNIVAGISITTDRIRNNISRKPISHIKNQIEKVNQESDKLYSGMRDFIWAIDSDNDSLSSLITYLTDYGRDIFEIDNIKFNIVNAILEEYLKLPYYWNKQLLLLFKEAFLNVLKHAEATKTTLVFEIEGQYITISFEDNGKGFNIEQIQRRSGLKNMYNRAQKINGDLNIDSKLGEYTRIIFKGKIYD